MWREARIVQIGYSVDFERVNLRDIFFKLCCVDIECSVLYVLTQFLPNWSQYVVVDGCRSKLVNACLECLREVLCAHSWSSSKPQSISPYWRTSVAAGSLLSRLDCCCANTLCESSSCRVPFVTSIEFVIGVTFGE